VEGLSRASGRLAGIYQYSRRGVSLDPPVLVQLRLRSGSNLETFSQPVVRRSYSGLRKSLQALMTAGFLGRLFLGCLPEREPDEQVFDLLCELFDALNDGVEPRVCGLWGQERLLQSLGLAPHLADCVQCQGGSLAGFSPADGGVMCKKCYEGAGVALQERELALCRLLRESTLLEVPVSELEPAGVRLAGRIFKAQFQTHLDLASDYFRRVLPPQKVGE
jgi:DNA repair protein RecO